MTEAAAGAETPHRRIALLVEYDGGRYAGSQMQKNALTVQAVLEEAISRVTSAPARTAFAGRTDAGTHARGQVASFMTASGLPAPVLMRALNAVLPKDVAVRDIAEVEPSFDPRRHAVRRHYRYTVRNADVRPALDRDGVWHVHGELDVAAMSEAAAMLVGVHDFAAFAGPMVKAEASTVREMMSLNVRREGEDVLIDAVANAFLPHQVRRITGALVEVGRGRMTAAAFGALLDGAPASAGPVAPAQGLCLMRVDYESPLFREGLVTSPAVC